jgi:methyltransferase (TIGR00027 family)
MSSYLARALSSLFSGLHAASGLGRPRAHQQTSELLLPDIVAFSSQICAASRAIEHAHTPVESRLFADPLAEHLAGPVAMRRARKRMEDARAAVCSAATSATATELVTARIPIRTRFFDEFLGSSVSALTASASPSSSPVQVVILGSGMDTRSFRVGQLAESPGIRLFEVDQKPVVVLKERLLARLEPPPRPLCPVVRVAADLSQPGCWIPALLTQGFDPREPRTIFIMEGLIYYFDAERVASLLLEVASLCSPDSLLSLSNVAEISSQPNSTTAALPCQSLPFPQALLTETDAHMAKLPFKFACADPIAFLCNLGFAVDSVSFLGGQNANYDRWPAGKPPSTKTMYIRFRLATRDGKNASTVV